MKTGAIKTTVEIRNDLLSRARKRAAEQGVPFRALLETALESHLARRAPKPAAQFKLHVFDKPTPTEEFSGMGWDQVRDLIYGEREERILHGRR